MFDFYFGEKDQILADERKYLLSVKRMLPRWCNSIPDSEYLAIYDDLMRSSIASDGSSGVIVETGSGASTLMLVYFAFRYNKKLYTWDLNQNKLSYIRSIILDTHERLFRRSMHDVWVYIPYLSTSPDLGIGILREKAETVDFGFFDSEHTSEVLLAEVSQTLPLANDGCVIALDDANYDYKYKNTAYVNVFRKKLGLNPIPDAPDNRTEQFYSLVDQLLRKQCKSVEKIADTYKDSFREDIFWSYYDNDRTMMNKLGMEKMQHLEHRYDSFRIIKK